ncbi:hypothetical protein [Mesoplasma coleopterae]|uniref:Uncharacterized protein n=1 Tax=Mesoplasma coleopterae TaxID=324078 RepID=A0A2K8P2D1_9MOLU|nr:hypothetical protein [Mesoplasma coleopterae]ATZ20836.1 hypothetical protein MCOLE_v1c03220 [Mesoplasma coleopterae]
MFQLLKEYINQNNKKDKSKLNEINDIKPYFTSGSGISSPSFSKDLNEAIIYISNHKTSNINNKYEDIVGIKQIKYFGRANDWKIDQEIYKPTSKNKVMELAFQKEKKFKLHVFIKNKPSHFVYLGEYYINNKMWISDLQNMQYQLLPHFESKKRDNYLRSLAMNDKSNIKSHKAIIVKENLAQDDTSELVEILREIKYAANYNKKTFINNSSKTYDDAIDKIQKYNLIHEEQIRTFSKSFENNKNFIVKEGKFSDLVIKDFSKKKIDIYEFKTVHDKNIIGQLTKSVGQLYFYEYLLRKDSDFYEEEYKVTKNIVMIEVEKNITDSNFNTVNNFVVNNSEMNIEWKEAY